MTHCFKDSSNETKSLFEALSSSRSNPKTDHDSTRSRIYYAFFSALGYP